METTIGAGDFKAKCLRLLDAVAEQRGVLVITWVQAKAKLPNQN